MSLIHQKNIYSQSNKPKLPNTFIGGVGGALNSATLLAGKLNGITASDIKLFELDGNNISCLIEKNYTLSTNSFRDIEIGNVLKYFLDVDGYLTSVGNSSLRGQSNFTNFLAKGVLNYGTETVLSSGVKEFYNPSCTSIGFVGLKEATGVLNIYIPSCTTLGTSVGDNNTLRNIKTNAKIYVNPVLMTNNGGGMDGDLVYAQNTKSATIVSVTNTTPPEAINNLQASNITATSVDLTFTAPTSVNGILNYDVFVDDGTNKPVKLYVKNTSITASGATVSGLLAGITYRIWIQAKSNFFTKGDFSNEITITTLQSI